MLVMTASGLAPWMSLALCALLGRVHGEREETENRGTVIVVDDLESTQRGGHGVASGCMPMNLFLLAEETAVVVIAVHRPAIQPWHRGLMGEYRDDKALRPR